GLLLADEVADRGRGDHHLGGEHPPRAVATPDELLRDDTLEHERELRAYLALLMRREGVDDPGDGLGGGASVERREDQVAGFCDGERGLDGLAVAHLTDQDHVGVLSQYLTERLRQDPDVVL